MSVAAGDEIAADDPIGLVGNSGNTSESHSHIHAQSSADFFAPDAVGLPVAFSDVRVDGDPLDQANLVQGDIVGP